MWMFDWLWASDMDELCRWAGRPAAVCSLTTMMKGVPTYALTNSPPMEGCPEGGVVVLAACVG